MGYIKEFILLFITVNVVLSLFMSIPDLGEGIAIWLGKTAPFYEFLWSNKIALSLFILSLFLLFKGNKNIFKFVFVGVTSPIVLYLGVRGLATL